MYRSGSSTRTLGIRALLLRRRYLIIVLCALASMPLCILYISSNKLKSLDVPPPGSVVRLYYNEVIATTNKSGLTAGFVDVPSSTTTVRAPMPTFKPTAKAPLPTFRPNNGTAHLPIADPYHFSLGNKDNPAFNRNYAVPYPPDYATWLRKAREQCSGNFVGYDNEFAYLHNVLLNNQLANGQLGGDNFFNLMKQDEALEFFKYRKGYWNMDCPSPIKYDFKEKNHADEWLAAMKYGSINTTGVDVVEEFTIAIERYEYVNLYHTFTDFYNAFLVMSFFNKTQAETNILIVDGHPWGSLDSVWGTLFNSVQRAGRVARPTLYKNLVWGIMGYNSPIFRGVHDISISSLHLGEQFRDFFLSSYNLPIHRTTNCSSLRLMFIWRREYKAHPRNPTGDVHRKINNEDELLEGVKNAFPNFTIRGAQLDIFDMRDQLLFVEEADILIGMHGAALSLSLLMQRNQGMVELMPSYVNPSWKGHFIVMAKWRNLIYKRWVNEDDALEFPNHYTKVPPEVVIGLIEEIVGKMCKM